jgi:O-acetyl-ADP-ribose deacetylase (regulator of RNase III)
MVSPANSFGMMDGGLDLAIRDQLGFSVERKLQEVIVEKHHGELPVGCAVIVATNDRRWRYLITAPTMRVPEPISFTINAYLAFRALLVAVEKFNGDLGKREIDTLVCCGLGTGIGKANPNSNRSPHCRRETMRAGVGTLERPPAGRPTAKSAEVQQTAAPVCGGCPSGPETIFPKPLPPQPLGQAFRFRPRARKQCGERLPRINAPCRCGRPIRS